MLYKSLLQPSPFWFNKLIIIIIILRSVFTKLTWKSTVWFVTHCFVLCYFLIFVCVLCCNFHCVCVFFTASWLIANEGSEFYPQSIRRSPTLTQNTQQFEQIYKYKNSNLISLVFNNVLFYVLMTHLNRFKSKFTQMFSIIITFSSSGRASMRILQSNQRWCQESPGL